MNYDEQEKLLAQQRARYIQQQDQQAPQGRMIGNRFVAANPLEYLAAGLRGYGGMRGEQLATQELGDLQKQKQEAMQGDMNAMITALRGKPAETVQPLTPNDDEGNVNAPIQMPAQAGGVDKFYEAAFKSQFPQFQQMGMQGALTNAQEQAKRLQAQQENQRIMGVLQAAKTPQEAIAAGVPADTVKAYYESQNYGKNKVGRTIDVIGANGEKMTQQIDEYGNAMGAPIPAYTAPVQVNQGGQVSFVVPKAGVSMPVTMSPSEKDASARGWATVKQGQERIGIEKTKAANAGAGGGNATEGERKAATLLQRMQNSEAQLEAALKANPNAAKPGMVQQGLSAMGMGTTANMLTPEARQQVEAAQLDILDSALTLGTGAAYTKEQLEGYRKSYFPQIGDKPQTIKDKQDRLNNVLSAARIAAGRAAGQVTAPTPQSGIDALLEKYK